MGTNTLTALVIATLLVASACSHLVHNGEGLAALDHAMENSASGLVPNLFQALIMIPFEKETQSNLVDVEASHVNVAQKTHPTDVISAFVSQYTKEGGDATHIDYMIKDKVARSLVPKRVLDLVSRPSDRPWRFERNGRELVVLKYKSIEACLKAHNMGLNYIKNKQNDQISYLVKFTPAQFEAEVSKEEFDQTFAEFFTETCGLFEVASNQGSGFKKSGLVFEFSAFESLLKSKLAPLRSAVLNAIKAHLTKLLEKTYGEYSVGTHSLSFAVAPEAPVRSVRVLADTPTTSSSDFAVTIKYCFSIVFFLLLAIISINLYSLEYQKDSLIYAKFPVKKNN